MKKYLTLFETIEAYNAATLDLPNVSLIEEDMSICYNPWVETRVVVKYNVTNTSSPTLLRSDDAAWNIFQSMEIDGVMLNELVTQYTFDTTGMHTVKYELIDDTKLDKLSGASSVASLFTNIVIECIIPNSVTSIGQCAFKGCTGLTSIDIPNSVTSIGNAAFASCTGLTSITIPNSVTSIGEAVFSGCTGLTSITIPNSVTSIGSTAFSGCTGLTSVTIPNSVTSIGTAVFNGTNALEILNYNANCELNGSFRGSSSWSNLETVIIGDSTPSIGASIFGGLSSLTNVIIGNSVTSIGAATFGGCSNLTSITCNATTAPTIQNSTFKNVKTGGTLTVPSGSSGYDVWMGTGDYYLGKYDWAKVEQ